LSKTSKTQTGRNAVIEQPIDNDMNLAQIQELIKFVAKSGVSEVALEQKDFKITIKAQDQRSKMQEVIQVAVPQVAAPAIAVPAPVAPPAPATAPVASEPAASSKTIEIKSPMIGTFYRSSSPDKPPFVEVGTDIKAGSTVCVIEAMKLFNEIEAEITGKIVKVLVNDATPVEYDQPLFLVEPA
jgi:acetyl-CoA carboxylase biotin carboxyl carrier protein